MEVGRSVKCLEKGIAGQDRQTSGKIAENQSGICNFILGVEIDIRTVVFGSMRRVFLPKGQFSIYSEDSFRIHNLHICIRYDGLRL